MDQNLPPIASAAAPAALRERSPMRHYLAALLAVAAATLARWLLDPALGDDLPFTLYLAAMMLMASARRSPSSTRPTGTPRATACESDFSPPASCAMPNFSC